jgi:uncharacterized protein (TIGR02453 family)
MLPKQYFAFFKGLEKNNTKAWFDEHRDEYEKFVKEPFRALVQELIEKIRTVDPLVQMDAKDAVFRINRDIRFSKDKSPYKTHMGAHISRYGRKAIGQPGFYFEVNAKGGAVGGGCYQPDAEHVAALRDLIMHESADFKKATTAAFKKTYGELRGERSKTVAPEHKEAAVKQPLLFNKQFYWWAELPQSVYTEPTCVATLFTHYKTARPLQEFFERAF